MAKIVNELHSKQFATLNQERRFPSVFQVGQKVWVLRPRGLTADKLQSWWIGPCVIKSRVGKLSYEVEVKPGRCISLHRSQLKPHFEDEFADENLELFHFRPTSEDFDMEMDEWEVESILKHRVTSDGKLEFLVKWKGYTQPSWEPLLNFIHTMSAHWKNYVKDHDLRFELLDYLKPKSQSVGSQVPHSQYQLRQRSPMGGFQSGLASHASDRVENLFAETKSSVLSTSVDTLLRQFPRKVARPLVI